MRDKERLLSFDEPVCFIFAHSALKEGWDNPNVFQICTLNQTVSEMKKRQEIGRGLRLCVNQDGERIFGDVVNILTVIANERYQDYAATLQSEYTEDGQEAPPQPTDALRKPAQRNNAIFRDEPEFQKFWEKLARRLTYHIHVDTDALIEECVERLNNQTFPDPRVVIERGSFSMTRYTLILEKVSGNQARITVRKTDTDDNTETSTRSYKRNDDLSRLINDESLRSFVITEIDEVHSCVRFGEFELYLDTPCHFQTQSGQRISERATVGASQTYPVFNLLDRTARETGLTRPTINAIFKRMREQKQGNLFRNPEGFAAVFVTEIRNALANHVAERIRFTLADTTPYDLDMLFPERKEFPQRELLEADEHGLYDQVQIDSGVETNFVTNYLKGDDKVLFYFKFPPAFKIGLPAIIGNYNPDWGIARYDDEGKIVLHLVRETKGTTDIQNLQFSHEKRKIICARKHFLALDIDYRVVSDKTADWWSSEELTQGTL
jgi:type III restriction enzyme